MNYRIRNDLYGVEERLFPGPIAPGPGETREWTTEDERMTGEERQGVALESCSGCEHLATDSIRGIDSPVYVCDASDDRIIGPNARTEERPDWCPLRNRPDIEARPETMITEGAESKGGLNDAPTQPRPDTPPQGHDPVAVQTARDKAEAKLDNELKEATLTDLVREFMEPLAVHPDRSPLRKEILRRISNGEIVGEAGETREGAIEQLTTAAVRFRLKGLQDHFATALTRFSLQTGLGVDKVFVNQLNDSKGYFASYEIQFDIDAWPGVKIKPEDDQGKG